MTVKIRHLLVMATLILLPLAGEAAGCDDMLRPKDDALFDFEFLKSKNFGRMFPLPSFTTPEFENNDFSLRAITSPLKDSSDDFKSSEIPVGELVSSAVKEVSAAVEAFKNLGMPVRSFLHIFVPTHLRAIRWSGNGRPTFLWHVTAVCDFSDRLEIPCVDGSYQIFSEERIRVGKESPSKIVVFDLETTTWHTIQDNFTVAHEIAHTTQNPDAFSDSIWREARADVGAFLVTGKTDLVIPSGATIAYLDSAGNPKYRKGKVIRSLTEPNVATVDGFLPRDYFYHENSQIISSSLFLVGRSLGFHRIQQFINWMDRSETGRWESPNSIPASSSEKVKARLLFLGSLIKRWSDEANLSQPEKKIILKILKDKKLLY